MNIWLTIGSSALVTVGVALAVLLGIWIFVKVAGKKIDWLPAAYEDIRPRLRFFVLTFALLVSTLVVERPDDIWWVAISQGLLILLILSGGFLVQEVVNYAVSRVIERFENGDQTDAEVRRIATQLRLIKRLASVIIAILAIGFALFTFPAVQGIGAGLLASAGVLSVIGGLAAQSVLGNLFAGIQLAFSNAIRVGDVVVVEGEWGTIGEITLSYVVVHIWDERRLIVPSTHFTSKSFETWTRKTSKVLGTVYMDVDWRVPVDKVRAEFEKFLKNNPCGTREPPVFSSRTPPEGMSRCASWSPQRTPPHSGICAVKCANTWSPGYKRITPRHCPSPEYPWITLSPHGNLG